MPSWATLSTEGTLSFPSASRSSCSLLIRLTNALPCEVQEEATVQLCLCACQQPVREKKSIFRPGHDAKLHGELKRNLEKDPLLRNERFTPEQRAYAVERGLIAE